MGKMKCNLGLLCLGLLTFSCAVVWESSAVGFLSLAILAGSFISMLYGAYQLFLKLPPIELNSYDALALSNLDQDIIKFHFVVANTKKLPYPYKHFPLKPQTDMFTDGF